MKGYAQSTTKLWSLNADGYSETRRTASDRTFSVSAKDPATGEEIDLYVDKDTSSPVVRYQPETGVSTKFLELYNTNNKQAIINLSYPVGICIETSTNTNPSSTLGGSWTLIDKHMKAQHLDSGIFTVNSDVCSIVSQAVNIHGHTLSFRIALKYTGSGLTDGDTSMGTIKLSAVGVSRFPKSEYQCNGYCEDTNASIGYSVGWEDGEIKYRYGELSTDDTVYFHFIIVLTNKDYTTDSFCDRFIWKRTA